MKTYTIEEVENLLDVQRSNCWVAAKYFSKDKDMLVSILNAPEPGSFTRDKKGATLNKWCYEYLGVNVEEVKEDLNKKVIEYRIVSKDGKGYMITCDYKSERLNIYVEKDKVVKITRG